MKFIKPFVLLKTSISHSNIQPMKELAVKKNDSLNYLRGLAAIGIMAYHMSLFTFGESDSSTFLARIKIYAVMIFYVLSGLTLFIANSKLQANKVSISIFYLKRFFRVVPLLWLATIFTYLLKTNQDMYTAKHLIVNITVLPGMIRSDAFEVNGAWSIGNELFFYTFFPLLFFLNKAKRIYFIAAVIIIFAAFALFTFKLLDPNITLGFQWSKYVNPFNQIFFFAIGIYIATLQKPPSFLLKWATLFIILFLAGIALYPVTGDPVMLVTGVTRLVLSALTILICYMFYISDFSFLPAQLKRVFQYLGDTSYSIYLLHPLIYLILKHLSDKFFEINSFVLISATVLLTLLMSKIVYERFEKYFMQIGKSVIDKKLAAS